MHCSRILQLIHHSGKQGFVVWHQFNEISQSCRVATDCIENRSYSWNTWIKFSIGIGFQFGSIWIGVQTRGRHAIQCYNYQTFKWFLCHLFKSKLDLSPSKVSIDMRKMEWCARHTRRAKSANSLPLIQTNNPTCMRNHSYVWASIINQCQPKNGCSDAQIRLRKQTLRPKL